MIREKTTSYLRHLHLVVRSEQQRLRIPIYIIRPEAPSGPLSQPSLESTTVITQALAQKKSFKNCYCIPFLFVITCLIIAIALLSSILSNRRTVPQCHVYNCSWADMTMQPTEVTETTSHDTSTVSSELLSTANRNISMTPIITSTSSSASIEQNLSYGGNCTEHEQCALSKKLFCEYEFDLNQKHCLCETTYFWNRYTQQCDRKKNINEICEYDNECRLDLDVTCDIKSNANYRRCRCIGEYYWSKISNCGALQIQDFVHCTDEMYISSCLIKEIENGVYHNVNIRQIQNNEIEFDYFIVDSPEMKNIAQTECCWSMSKRYCFGIDSETNRLLIIVIGIDGIESYHSINQSVIGLPNVLRQIDNKVVCYLEGSDSSLLSVTIDPTNNDSLRVSERSGKTYGERSCFIIFDRTTYCFYRDIDHHLVAIIMNETTTVTENIQNNVHSDINLKTGPSCGWIGTNSVVKLYCFAVFNNEQIHRIERKDNVWSEWVVMPSEKTFVQRPLFVTSHPSNDFNRAQRFLFREYRINFKEKSSTEYLSFSCHVLAIDTSNEVYVSSNTNCVHQDLFSPWSLLETDVGLLSFNGSFRLRDGRIGIFGVGIDDLPYYTIMNPETDNFEPIRLATSFIY